MENRGDDLMGDNMDEDYNEDDEDMGSEEEKDDRPSLGIAAHMEIDSQQILPPRKTSLEHKPAEPVKIEVKETPEQKEEREKKVAEDKKKRVGVMAKSLFG
jgi:hypothetical protein